MIAFSVSMRPFNAGPFSPVAYATPNPNPTMRMMIMIMTKMTFLGLSSHFRNERILFEENFLTSGIVINE